MDDPPAATGNDREVQSSAGQQALVRPTRSETVRTTRSLEDAVGKEPTTITASTTVAMSARPRATLQRFVTMMKPTTRTAPPPPVPATTLIPTTILRELRSHTTSHSVKHERTGAGPVAAHQAGGIDSDNTCASLQAAKVEQPVCKYDEECIDTSRGPMCLITEDAVNGRRDDASSSRRASVADTCEAAGPRACDVGEECIDTSEGRLCITDPDYEDDLGPSTTAATRSNRVPRSRSKQTTLPPVQHHLSSRVKTNTVRNMTQSALDKQKAALARIRAALKTASRSSAVATSTVASAVSDSTRLDEVLEEDHGFSRYAANIVKARPDTTAGSGPTDCSNRYPACKDEWEACCPGRSGGPQCGDPDCNTDRKAGRPCLGIFMQLECPRVCGLCDSHDLVRTAQAEQEIDEVDRDSTAEIEALQTAFRKVRLVFTRCAMLPQFF